MRRPSRNSPDLQSHEMASLDFSESSTSLSPQVNRCCFQNRTPPKRDRKTHHERKQSSDRSRSCRDCSSEQEEKSKWVLKRQLRSGFSVEEQEWLCLWRCKSCQGDRSCKEWKVEGCREERNREEALEEYKYSTASVLFNSFTVTDLYRDQGARLRRNSVADCIFNSHGEMDEERERQEGCCG